MKHWGMGRRVLAFLLALAALTGAASAEVAYEWSGEFPATPELQHHAYLLTGMAYDAEELVGKLWEGLDWNTNVGDSHTNYGVPASESRSGFNEDIYNWEDGLEYIVDRTRWLEMEDIGGADAAYRAAEEFFSAWLPAEYLVHRAPAYGSFDEDGNPIDHYYELLWLQEIESGVTAYDAAVRAQYYSCGVQHAVVRWRAFEPVEADAPAYLTAEQALQSLNYAAANIDPEHVCTSFDDPEDKIVAIAPVFANVFDGEKYTLCWAFSIQDAEKGFVRRVLVDAVSGDIFDDHDGWLEGCF